MKRFTFRDPEGVIRWIPELLEDDTGLSGELIRGRMCELEDLLDGCSLARLRELVEADRDGRCVVLYEAAKAIGSPWEEFKQIERERDAAVSDLETVMAYGGGNLDTCQFCKNGQCYARGGTRLCNPVWRGPQEKRA